MRTFIAACAFAFTFIALIVGLWQLSPWFIWGSISLFVGMVASSDITLEDIV